MYEKDWGRFTMPDAPARLRWTLHKAARHATCKVVPHPLGFEMVVEVDGEPMLTQVHRLEVDADLHAATLEDHFGGRAGHQPHDRF
jgi:hypothetical protein